MFFFLLSTFFLFLQNVDTNVARPHTTQYWHGVQISSICHVISLTGILLDDSPVNRLSRPATSFHSWAGVFLSTLTPHFRAIR